jgi:hypothetical protein
MKTDEKKRMKMAIIAGASRALSYKEKKPSATESEVISSIIKGMNEIIAGIEE